ncbi:FecR family protein [Steroidobacter sp.]|uniref:FecR family protein n=1 Tax=Steroidobacter sp. TaxID=1978227 RepID=UPI001A50508B|nr:FecR domain-containing protein [Steroidobacter sp.]MBL8272093.1 FecR domain-containing protein [Steroidobacter sp.]
MNQRTEAHHDAQLLETAANWLFKLRDPEVSEADISAWFAWCDGSTENRRAFEQVQATWRQSGLIDEQPVTSTEIDSDGYLGQVPVAEWNKVRTSSQRRAPVRRFDPRRARIAAALVAGVATLLLLGWMRHVDQARDMTVSAVVGVNREVLLPDGSEVTLAAGSKLSTRFTSGTRNVFLENGEALFKVKHMHARPFIVHAMDTTVTAVGTAFNVKSEGGAVRVTVTEGIVDVAHQRPLLGELRQLVGGSAGASDFRLASGNQVTLSAGAPKPVAITAASPQVTTWTEGTLSFVDEPLVSVVAAVNRYAAVPLVLEEGELGNYLYTGTVVTGRIDEWLRGLPNVFPVSVQHSSANQVVLRTRAESMR